MPASALPEGTAMPSRESAAFGDEVKGMFDRISGVYDLLNTVMTAGLHHQWRQRAADRAGLEPGDTALDIACGTGDLSFELAARCGPDGRVVGCDFSEGMLEIARQKADGRPAHETEVRFEWADGLDLPYEDGEFDAVTIGFGLRNFSDIQGGLIEMSRVLRTGGRLVVLELSQPRRPPLSTFYAFWFDRLVPLLGKVFGNSGAYTYLPESVKRFPGPEALAAQINEAGFGEIRWLDLAGGIVSVHSATKQ